MKSIKEIIAENIVNLRIENGLTQSALAEKLNYTDKAVSKWEHGDTLPPIEVLKEIADMFGVTLDYLVTEDNDVWHDKTYNGKRNNTNKIVITMLATLTVWLIATFLYVYGYILTNVSNWILFVIAVPISCIVLLIFNGIWGKRAFVFIILSIFTWSLITFFYLAILPYYNAWPSFILGAPFQVAIILWSRLKPNKNKNNLRK